MYSSITIAEIRRRINALKRKLALPYAVVRITRLADDYAAKCSVAHFDRKPWPDFLTLGQAIRKLGYRLDGFNQLNRYLRGCQERREIPTPAIIVATFLSPGSPGNYDKAYEKHYESVWNMASSVSNF